MCRRLKRETAGDVRLSDRLKLYNAEAPEGMTLYTMQHSNTPHSPLVALQRRVGFDSSFQIHLPLSTSPVPGAPPHLAGYRLRTFWRHRVILELNQRGTRNPDWRLLRLRLALSWAGNRSPISTLPDLRPWSTRPVNFLRKLSRF